MPDGDQFFKSVLPEGFFQLGPLLLGGGGLFAIEDQETEIGDLSHPVVVRITLAGEIGIQEQGGVDGDTAAGVAGDLYAAGGAIGRRAAGERDTIGGMIFLIKFIKMGLLRAGRE